MSGNMRPDEYPADPERDKTELLDAAQEIRTSELPPEVDPKTASLEAWNDVPDESGREVPKVAMEDEIPAVEQLVEEGMEEADREQRIAAADPDSAL